MSRDDHDGAAGEAFSVSLSANGHDSFGLLSEPWRHNAQPNARALDSSGSITTPHAGRGGRSVPSA